MTSDNCIAAISFLPTTAVLEMTYKCNHGCLFCSCPWFAQNNGFETKPELTAAQWKEAISKVSAMGADNICFTGGEALLRPDIWDIIAHAAGLKDTKVVVKKTGGLAYEKKAMKLYLISNGKLLDDKTLGLIKKYDIQLSVSLPGLESFEKLTGGNNNIDRVLAAINAAKQKGLSVVAGITVTKHNLPELYKNIAAAFLAGADQLLMNIFLKGGRGLKYAGELALTGEEVLLALDTADKALADSGRRGSLDTEIPLCLLGGKTYKNLKTAHKCSAAKGFFVIGPGGYIRVCNHSPKHLEHYTEIEKVKDNPYWRSFTQKQYMPQKCLGCLHTDCEGGCREEAHILHGSICGDNLYIVK